MNKKTATTTTSSSSNVNTDLRTCSVSVSSLGYFFRIPNSLTQKRGQDLGEKLKKSYERLSLNLASDLRIPQRHKIYYESLLHAWPAGIALPPAGDAY